MKPSYACRMGAVLLAGALAACATGHQAGAGQSGFLKDYSRLSETKDTRGKTVRAWTSPKLSPATYQAILLEPLVFYPEPQPTEQVSSETLQQILAYSDETLRQSLGQRFQLVNRPGPGVLRLRAAFTGVAAQDEGLKPYQFVPIAFVATMAARTATGTPQRATIVVEVEATDSLTGELLGQRVRMGTGERLSSAGSQRTITLETVKPLLDEMTAGAFPELANYVKPR